MKTYYVAGFPYSDELWHHGIKGQKWGIRRYQNEDGSLTPAGKERYGTAENMRNQMALDEARSKYKKANRKGVLSVWNPKNLFSKDQREKTKANILNADKLKGEVNKAKIKADESEKAWKQDLYKDEIKRGRELSKNGYDYMKESLRRDYLDVKYNEIMEQQQDRIDRGEEYSLEYNKAEISLKMIEHEADSIDRNLRDYDLYEKWGK